MAAMSSTAKILLSYLESYTTALVFIGLLYFLGLFGGGLFSAGSPVTQLLSR